MPTAFTNIHHSDKLRPRTLGIAKFAEAKASTYDKQSRKDKVVALNSKVVNKYRKLKARLEGVDGLSHLQMQQPQVS